MSESFNVPPEKQRESVCGQGGNVEVAGSAERVFATVLADVVRVDRVSVDSDFFEDLGANSLVMAHFCARVRKRAEVPSVSMKDVYANPTIRSLAASVGGAAPALAEPAAAKQANAPPRGGTAQYVLCGLLQFLAFVGYAYLAALLVVRGVTWVSAAGTNLLHIYLRLVLFTSAAFVGLCVLPIVAKWVLIGRWKPRRIRVWTLDYFRFWLVKTLVQRNLVALLALGSPLYVLYLKALGAKIGRGVAIFSRNVPVCTDLLTIGEGSVIRKDSFLLGYRAEAGEIQTGSVTLGKDVFVGELSVIDIDTSIGDGAQLGHASSLHPRQAVPAGEHWHGSPAWRTETDYRGVGPAGCGMVRRFCYGVSQLLALLLVYLPLAIGGVDLLLATAPQLATFLSSEPLQFTSWAFYLDALAVSFVIFFGGSLITLLLVAAVPRVLGVVLKPDRVYRLYGFRYSLHRAIRVVSNLKFFITLFGDSSAIVHYLRYLGYRMPDLQQTGSNFGSVVKHETPQLSTVGSGTMIADGLSIINADFSSTSFRVARTKIGGHNFLGNNVAYPAQSRAGENCLLGTKVLVPVDGPVRENVGLLGSPSFEIPRTVARDRQFDHLRSGDALRRGLAAKNRHNSVTIVMFLLVRWIYFLGLVLLGWATTDVYPVLGLSAIALASLVGMLFSVCYFTLVERASQVIHPLQPLYCSIYDIRFWRHERFWKAAAMAYVQAFNGTPFKGVIWRMLGARIGRRLFDDGCGLPEKTLVTIGDDVTFNPASKLQCHSQEDGTFKADRIAVGSGCTIGVGALVHYGASMGDGASLTADSFLMKGEEVPPHAWWGGNPASEIRAQDSRVSA
ncbi:Pls/PosA family non-ribosomal peptide synthetase [Amycolatopsis sp. DSM 110486]|uniref:Pls/PosA family non-ribosomal peptide synthetase n=1 Tax=Amycolatopsis sp. DSM 110486 TaxID=2865832 RepID=UPI001C69DE4E|nr:Pls/PosA family non-ribosomal peptide synthetase [Amycolatopsis sp. DSM 110486]QYN21518.1 peptide synthetase [Amycolatopsis sp. DSM 110486]